MLDTADNAPAPTENSSVTPRKRAGWRTTVTDKPLTPLQERTLACLVGKPPSRRTEIAAMLGIGRGSAIRIVDSLRASGAIAEVEPGRFAVAPSGHPHERTPGDVPPDEVMQGKAGPAKSAKPAREKPRVAKGSKPVADGRRFLETLPQPRQAADGRPRAKRKRLPERLSDRVLSLIERNGAMSSSDVLRFFSDHPEGSVNSALFRLAETGLIERVLRGRYRKASGPAVTPPSVDVEDVRRAVAARWPGETWTRRELVEESGTSYLAVDEALRQLCRAGEVRRLARGIYGKAGDVGEPDFAGRLGQTCQLLRIMAEDDRVWATVEFGGRIVGCGVGKEAWLLNNAHDGGWLERVAPGRWRLSEKGRERGRRLSDGDRGGGDELLGVIESGVGLWSASGIAQRLRTSPAVISPVLDRLEAEGSIVHFAYGYWRAVHVEVDPERVPDRSTVRALGALVRHGVRRVEDFPGGSLAKLMSAGLCEISGAYRRKLRPAWERALKSRLQVVDKRPSIGVHEAAVSRAVRFSDPLGPDEIASLCGLNGIDCSRAMDGLLAAGRLIETEPGRYMLG